MQELPNKPACATMAEYVHWLEAAVLHWPLNGFCRDCTPGFQARMKVAGRCDYPEVWFDNKGGRRGKREVENEDA